MHMHQINTAPAQHLANRLTPLVVNRLRCFWLEQATGDGQRDQIAAHLRACCVNNDRGMAGRSQAAIQYCQNLLRSTGGIEAYLREGISHAQNGQTAVISRSSMAADASARHSAPVAPQRKFS